MKLIADGRRGLHIVRQENEKFLTRMSESVYFSGFSDIIKVSISGGL